MNFRPAFGRGIALATAFFLMATAPLLAAPLRPLEGPIILAKAGSSPLYLWNATLYVAHLVSDKALGDDGLHALEATAVDALGSHVSASSAKMVSLEVVYARTGAVSPVYNAPTFTGMEKVLTISVPCAALVRDRASWSQALASGKIPPGVRIDVTGKLPPR
jgi:hypothetical protein